MDALIVQAIAWCQYCANYDRRLLDVVFLFAAARVGQKVDIGQRIMAPVAGLNATKQTGVKMKKLILLLPVLIPAVALAQEKADPTEAEVVRLVLETPSKTVAWEALRALERDERELEVLLNVYQALDGTQAIQASSVLRHIASALGGADYLKNLFASLEPPKEPCKPRPQLGLDNGPPGPPEEELCPYKTEWCEVGKVLIGRGVHHSLIYPTCDNTIEYTEDGRILWHSH